MLQKDSSFYKSAVVWLPLLLFGLTYLLLGFFYETNDDLTISLLLRGIVVQPPSNDLSLYFHGLSHGLVWLYKLAPQWPWYGLVLYCFLYLATVIAFLFLQQPGAGKYQLRVVWLLLFFIASWVEHLYWFNYMRVPLLLAGTSFLLLLKKPFNQKKWPVLAIIGSLFLLALCIRPSAALLGFAVVGPAAFFLTAGPVFSWQKLRPIFWFASIACGFFIFLALSQSPAEKQYQRLDWLKSTVLDFQIYNSQPQTEKDALALQAIGHWMLADTKIINEDFYKRVGSIGFTHIITKVAPVKLPAVLAALVRDHFLVLAFNFLILFFLLRSQWSDFIQNRKLIFAYQVYFWLLILALGIFLKLPPRVISPCLSLYTLINWVFYLRVGIKVQTGTNIFKFVGMILIFLVGLQLYKIAHRIGWQQQNQQANEAFISAAGNTFQGKILVTDILPDYFRSLSPFRQYDFGSNQVFSLTGWNSLDPGNRIYYNKLTGHPDFSGAVLALSRNNNTVWLLSPGFFKFIKVYFKTFYRQEIYLQPAPYILKGQYPVKTYRPGYNLP